MAVLHKGSVSGRFVLDYISPGSLGFARDMRLWATVDLWNRDIR